MTELFNQSTEKQKRRILRRNATTAESLMWQQLRNRQLANCKFRRQYSVGPFVLDFYCPELKLAIEIDGESHNSDEAIAYDQIRQRRLEAIGIRFLRFTNEQVYKHLSMVVEKVDQTIQALRR